MLNRTIQSDLRDDIQRHTGKLSKDGMNVKIGIHSKSRRDDAEVMSVSSVPLL
jgi:hypothetical protein